MNIDALIADDVRTVDRMLNQWLPKEPAKPAAIHRAMRYSLFADGKLMRRVRAGIRRLADAMPSACAIDYAHTFTSVRL